MNLWKRNKNAASAKKRKKTWWKISTGIINEHNFHHCFAAVTYAECMCPQCWSNHRESKPSSTLYFFNRWFTHLTKTSHACDWCYNGNSPYIHYLDRSALFIRIYESNQSHHNNGFIKQYSLYVFYDTKNEIEKRREKKRKWIDVRNNCA